MLNLSRESKVGLLFLLSEAWLQTFSIQISPHERKNYLKNTICKSNYDLHLLLCTEMGGSNFGVSSTIYDELMLSGKPPILKTDEIVMGGTQ